MKYFVTIGTREIAVEVDGGQVTVDGTPMAAHLDSVPGTPLRVLAIDASSHELVVSRPAPGEWSLAMAGSSHVARVVDERTRHIRSLTGDAGVAAGPAQLKAPMPGLVVRVSGAVGDGVEAGQGLVVLEAMKMENELRATSAAVISAIRVAPGQAVEKGEVLIEFAPVRAGAGNP